jgi:S-adenosylmethionine hydrolase
MHKKRVITLLSDFGIKDPYVAEMKAVILSICQEATIVDISHDIKKFDIRMGAFILAQASPYFPEGTVHVAVVDPGVGTERRPIIIETKRGFYVGPDNGLLIPAARNDGIRCIYEIANPKYQLKTITKTFHGRDIFSPAAAYLASGISPSDFGPEVHDPITPSFAETVINGEKIRGEVVQIDDFGNVITNIGLKDLNKARIKEGMPIILRLKSEELRLKFCSTYGDAPKHAPLVLIGSSGLLEIAVNQGNAAKSFKIEIGDEVILKSS